MDVATSKVFESVFLYSNVADMHFLTVECGMLKGEYNIEAKSQELRRQITEVIILFDAQEKQIISS